MNKSEIQNYLSRVLDCTLELHAEELKELPFFLQKMFQIYSGILFGKKIFFLFTKEDFFDGHSIKDLESATTVFRNKSISDFPVFVFSSLSKQQRLVLVKRKMSFLVPDKQMFLPYLAIDFSDRIRETTKPQPNYLPPAAQAILLEQLLSGKLDGLPLVRIAEITGYTLTSVIRASEQLKKFKLCSISSDGYRKSMHFKHDRKALWDASQEYLRSPIKNTVSVANDEPFAKHYPFAGEYALAQQSNLAANRKCYAISDSDYSRLRKAGLLRFADAAGTGAADIQVWSYWLPNHIGEFVDPLSLELSFKNTNDARIKGELLEIKENRQW